MEKPKDRDFVETADGMLFCLVGYLHPPDRYTAYLKYIPDSEGCWRRDETRYRRAIPFYHVSQVENTYQYLKENYPQYLYRCPIRNITTSSVPYEFVDKYYRPRERLNSILKEGAKDQLEHKLEGLVTILSGLSGLSLGNLGVTGSLLAGNHNPEFSDIDLTVYGLQASNRLKETLLEMKKSEAVIQHFDVAKKKVWSRSRAERFPLSFTELMDFAERRWNYGVFYDTYFSIHPTRTDNEITESYGDFYYSKKGELSGTAFISDSSESIFLPAVYKIKEVETENNGREDIPDIIQIVSYEGLFCDMFEAGEKVEFKGIIEKVEGKREFHQIILGGAGSDPSYMKRIF